MSGDEDFLSSHFLMVDIVTTFPNTLLNCRETLTVLSLLKSHLRKIHKFLAVEILLNARRTTWGTSLHVWEHVELSSRQGLRIFPDR